MYFNTLEYSNIYIVVTKKCKRNLVCWTHCESYNKVIFKSQPENGLIKSRNMSLLYFNYLLITFYITMVVLIKVKGSRYRPGVTQRVGRGIALLFHDHGTRRGWVVSSTPRPHFTPGKDPVPILQEVGSAPGPVWTGGKSRPQRMVVLIQ